jgi:hypothetical protein
MKNPIIGFSLITFIISLMNPVQADAPGHVYVYADMQMEFYEPAQKTKIKDGEVTCNTYGYGYLAKTNCIASEPVYVERPARNFTRVLRVKIDCTDETYDAEGDGKPWGSIRNDGGVYRMAMERCSMNNSSSVNAFQQAAPAGNQRAATTDELNTYIGTGAINMCGLAQAKVPFKAAVDTNLKMLVSVLSSKHGSMVPGAQAPISQEQLVNGSLLQLVLRVDAICGKSLPPDWKNEFDPLLAQVKQAIQSAGKGAKK